MMYRLDNPQHHRKTGIVCTLGPSSRSVEMVKKLIGSGMNVARLNFSHGDHEYHGGTIRNIRAAIAQFENRRAIAIALDIKGPKIRTGLLASNLKEVELKKGEKIRLSTDESMKNSCTSVKLYVDYKNITKVVQAGSRIFIDDGLIELVVEDIDEKSQSIICVVENGGMLGSKKGVNLPGTMVDLPAVSQKDIEDLKFGVQQDVDMIFASFIRDADGVRSIRKVLGEEGKEIKIISKIESQQGIDNIDEIIVQSDGIMVARGDMGIEIPAQKVFLAQKMIITKCNRAGKPVICATQMLESMVSKPRPTRAEVSDVANAVLDGADCVMLSGETAKGDYPLETVQIMDKICREAEAVLDHTKLFEELLRVTPKPMDVASTCAVAAVSAAVNCGATAIIAISATGRSAALISKYRPPCPVLCVTRTKKVASQLHLFRGLVPVFYPYERDADWTKDIENRLLYGVDVGKHSGIIHPRDYMVLVTGWKKGAGFTNTIRVVQALENPLLFVGTYTKPLPHVPNPHGEGIGVFKMEFEGNESIRLSPVTTITNVVSPAFLDLTHNKKFLYAVTEIDSSEETKIHGFQISNENGFQYKQLGSWSIEGVVTSHVLVDPQDRFVFVSNYGSGKAVAFKIDSDTGKLEKRNSHQFTEHSNVIKERQEAPHLHSALMDSKSKFVYFADLGNDCLYRFDYSLETGFDSRTMKKFHAPPGCGPRHMAFDPIYERYMYVSCELSSHLLVYSVDGQGSLEQVDYASTVSANSNYPGMTLVSDIHVSPDGRFVYIATRFIDTLSVFQVQANGKVALIQEIKTDGQVPRNFLLYAPRNLVLVGNQQSDNVAVFKRDGDTGKLNQINSMKVDTAACFKVLE